MYEISYSNKRYHFRASVIHVTSRCYIAPIAFPFAQREMGTGWRFYQSVHALIGRVSHLSPHLVSFVTDHHNLTQDARLESWRIVPDTNSRGFASFFFRIHVTFNIFDIYRLHKAWNRLYDFTSLSLWISAYIYIYIYATRAYSWRILMLFSVRIPAKINFPLRMHRLVILVYRETNVIYCVMKNCADAC